MKKTIAIITLLISLNACNNSKTDYQRKPSDTVRTAAIYIGGSGGIEGGFVFRVTRDSLAFDSLDSETIKKKWKRDTAYFIPEVVPLTDSLGKTMLDSLGKAKQTIRYFPTPTKNILQDYNRQPNK